MPPVGAAIAGAIGLGATAATVITAGLEIGLSVGLSYLAKALGDKPSPNATGVFSPQLQSGANLPRSFLIGRCATAGSLVYANTWGSSGKTPNAYLTQVIALSDIPVQGMANLLVNGGFVAFDPSASQAGMGYAVPSFIVGGKPYLWVKFYNGRQTTADPFLLSTFGADPNYPWTSDMVGTGVAYAIVTCLVNQSLFAGDPNFTFVVDGIRLYDPRKDSTAGGAGPQRFANQNSWEFTRNPAVALYNLLMGISYGGNWFYGLQSVTQAGLPFSSWAAAMNACDAILPSGQVQYQCGGEILVSTEPVNEIEALLKAMNGRLAEIGGIYKIVIGAAGAAVMSFSDQSLLVTEQQVFTEFESLDQTVNGITAKFLSPASGWTVVDAPARYNLTYQAEDGGRRVVANIDYGRVPYANQVQRLMLSALQEARRARKHVIPLGPSAWVLEPLDFVAWTSARNGYASKLFRVDKIDDKDNLDVFLYLTEVDPSDYSWSDGANLLPEVDYTISVLTPAAQAINSWAATPIVITGDTGIQRAGIRLGWDPLVDDVNGVQYEVELASSSAVIARGETDRFDAGYLDISHNIVAQTAYQVRGIYRPKGDRAVTWSSWLPVTTGAINLDPAISAAIAQETLARQQADVANAAATLVAQNLAQQITANNMVGIFTLGTISAGVVRYGIYLNAATSANPTWVPTGFFIDIVNGVGRMFIDVDYFAVGRSTTPRGSPDPNVFLSIVNGVVLMNNAVIKNLTVDNVLGGGLSQLIAAPKPANIALKPGVLTTLMQTPAIAYTGRGKFSVDASVLFSLQNRGRLSNVVLYAVINGSPVIMEDLGYGPAGYNATSGLVVPTDMFIPLSGVYVPSAKASVSFRVSAQATVSGVVAVGFGCSLKAVYFKD